MSAVSDPRPAAGAPQAPPAHVAIIMDGNRRWAEARGVPIALGHRAGAEAARRAVEAAAQAGIGWLTLVAFSSENCRRPTEEVSARSGLLRLYLRNEVAALVRDGVKLHVIGDHSRFGADLSAMVADAEKATAGGTRLNLVMALSYGARDEILAATRAIASAAKAGTLDPEALSEAQFSGFLQTAGMPDPHLGRTATVEFPALAGGLCGVCLYGCAVAGFFRRGFAGRSCRIPSARTPLWAARLT